MESGEDHIQQNLPAALAAGAVAPRVLAPARQRSRTKHKRDVCFVLCREALRAHLVTQNGFTDRQIQRCVTKRQVNSTLCAMPKYLFMEIKRYSNFLSNDEYYFQLTFVGGDEASKSNPYETNVVLVCNKDSKDIWKINFGNQEMPDVAWNGLIS